MFDDTDTDDDRPTVEVDEEELNRLCWDLVHTLTDFECRLYAHKAGITIHEYYFPDEDRQQDSTLIELLEWAREQLNDEAADPEPPIDPDDNEHPLWPHDEDIDTGSYEYGYAAGMMNEAEMRLGNLKLLGIDPIERGHAYAEENELNIVPAWWEDVDAGFEPEIRESEAYGLHYTCLPEDPPGL